MAHQDRDVAGLWYDVSSADLELKWEGVRRELCEESEKLWLERAPCWNPVNSRNAERRMKKYQTMQARML